MDDFSTYSLMQSGKPYKSFIKTILGKVYVNVLNSFTKQPEGVILKGNPRANDKDGCIVDIWNEMEFSYFMKHPANKRHLANGVLVEYTREEVAPSASVNVVSDEEVDTLLNGRFGTLQKRCQQFDSEAPLYRLIERARELEKSEKVIAYLEGRLSDLQSQEYGSEEE